MCHLYRLAVTTAWKAVLGRPAGPHGGWDREPGLISNTHHERGWWQEGDWFAAPYPEPLAWWPASGRSVSGLITRATSLQQVTRTPAGKGPAQSVC